MIRLALPSDGPRIDAFLREHADSSMFLRSNLRAAGLVDRGEPLQGTWAIALHGEQLLGVVALAWNGMVLVQAPGPDLEALVHTVVGARPERAVAGLTGPLEQVERARAALGLESDISAEDLFVLELAELRLPGPLAEGSVRCRRTVEGDLERCAAWRTEYLVETFRFTRTAALEARARDDVAQAHARRDAFVLERNGELVAYSTFNARLPERVQIGGVFTPLDLRSQGLARSVVAASLQIARAEGVSDAVLFTGRDNAPARRAYVSLGFRIAGAYGIALFPR